MLIGAEAVSAFAIDSGVVRLGAGVAFKAKAFMALCGFGEDKSFAPDTFGVRTAAAAAASICSVGDGACVVFEFEFWFNRWGIFFKLKTPPSIS